MPILEADRPANQQKTANESGEGVVGVEKGFGHRRYSAANFFGALDQCFDDESVCERSITKRYLEGGLDFCFLCRVAHPLSGKFVANGDNIYAFRVHDFNHGVLREFGPGEEFPEYFLIYGPSSEGENFVAKKKESVLVDDVEGVDPVEYEVPCRIRLEKAYCFDDLFAGELYLSAFDGRFKSIRSVAFGEGELDQFRFGGSVFSHLEKSEVQCGSEVVDGIADDEGKLWRDGLLLFGSQGNLIGLATVVDHEFKRVLRKEGFDAPIKVVDVMAGPL